MQAFRVTLDSLSGGFTNLNSSAPGDEEKQPAVDSPAAPGVGVVCAGACQWLVQKGHQRTRERES